MRSIFHVEASTAEELRTELIRWLEEESDRISLAGASARLVRDAAASNAERIAVRRVLNFWREIIIDPRKENHRHE